MADNTNTSSEADDSQSLTLKAGAEALADGSNTPNEGWFDKHFGGSNNSSDSGRDSSSSGSNVAEKGDWGAGKSYDR
jgi:hypothetical protein